MNELDDFLCEISPEESIACELFNEKFEYEKEENNGSCSD